MSHRFFMQTRRIPVLGRDIALSECDAVGYRQEKTKIGGFTNEESD